MRCLCVVFCSFIYCLFVTAFYGSYLAIRTSSHLFTNLLVDVATRINYIKHTLIVIAYWHIEHCVTRAMKQTTYITQFVIIRIYTHTIYQISGRTAPAHKLR